MLCSRVTRERKKFLQSDYRDSRLDFVDSRLLMASSKLTKLELQIMETFWTRGACSVREVQEAFPEPGRPAYTTVQTTVYRLERKRALRLVKRISNANIFEAAISRNDAQRRVIDELLSLFGGRGKPVMAHLVESGSLTLDDVKEAERELRKLTRKDKLP
jgi:BlaI family transcriptional regulator, penicillinase repressor